MKPTLTKREIERAIAWLLVHRQAEVRAAVRKFQTLARHQQKMLGQQLLLLISILDQAVSSAPRAKPVKSVKVKLRRVKRANRVKRVFARYASQLKRMKQIRA